MADKAPAYSIVVERGVAIARFTRQPSARDVNDATAEFARLDKNNRRLWDLRVGMNLTQREIQEAAAFAKYLKFPASRIAILVKKGVSFGIARMLQRYREQDTQEYLVLDSEEEAMKWLLAESSAKLVV